MDGANGWQRFRYVILPALWPSTVVTITVSIIDSLRAFDTLHYARRAVLLVKRHRQLHVHTSIQQLQDGIRQRDSRSSVHDNSGFHTAYLASALRQEVDYT